MYSSVGIDETLKAPIIKPSIDIYVAVASNDLDDVWIHNNKKNDKKGLREVLKSQGLEAFLEGKDFRFVIIDSAEANDNPMGYKLMAIAELIRFYSTAKRVIVDGGMYDNFVLDLHATLDSLNTENLKKPSIRFSVKADERSPLVGIADAVAFALRSDPSLLDTYSDRIIIPDIELYGGLLERVQRHRALRILGIKDPTAQETVPADVLPRRYGERRIYRVSDSRRFMG